MTGAIILAGGENTRMGENKALLDLGGQPLIQHIVNKFSEFFDNIYIVTTTPEEYSFLKNVTFVADLFPDNKNTLEAIYSGLLASREDSNFVCACDMPYLSMNLIKYLFSIQSDFEVVSPVFEYKPAALHTIYSKSCLPVMEKNLKKNNKKVARLLRDLNVKYVPEEALITEDPKLISFFHIKTFVDYMIAQKDF